MLLSKKTLLAALAFFGRQATTLPKHAGGATLTGSADATCNCMWSYNILYNKFVVDGEGWPGEEKEMQEEIKRAAKKVGVVTHWESRNSAEDGGFDVVFNLPIHTADNMEEILNAWLPLLKAGRIRCVKGTREQQGMDY